MIKAISKSLFWNFIGILFGLMQLAILFLLKSLDVIFFDDDKILKDGVILFFCSAFVFASVTEHYFNEYRYAKLFEAFFFNMLPILLIIFVVALYCGCTIGLNSVDIGVLKKGTYICFIFSIIYSIIFHTLKFYSKGSK